MGWWIATFIVWFISAGWIIGIMVGVARGKSRAFNARNIGAIAFHGVTAVIVIFLLIKALGA